MSVYRELVCDRCARTFPFDLSRHATEARRVAKLHGWTRGRDTKISERRLLDFCPDCSSPCPYCGGTTEIYVDGVLRDAPCYACGPGLDKHIARRGRKHG